MKRHIYFAPDTGGGLGGGIEEPVGETGITGKDGNAAAPAAAPQPETKYTEADFETLRASLTKEFEANTQKAVSDALERAKLPPDEAARRDEADRLQKLADREAAISMRELRADAAEALTQKNLPASVLDIVIGADKDATAKNIEAFGKAFDAAVQAQVEKRLAGKTPAGGNGGGAEVDAFTRGFLREGGTK